MRHLPRIWNQTRDDHSMRRHPQPETAAIAAHARETPDADADGEEEPVEIARDRGHLGQSQSRRAPCRGAPLEPVRRSQHCDREQDREGVVAELLRVLERER